MKFALASLIAVASADDSADHNIHSLRSIMAREGEQVKEATMEYYKSTQGTPYQQIIKNMGEQGSDVSQAIM
jgi:hypothetical protein